MRLPASVLLVLGLAPFGVAPAQTAGDLRAFVALRASHVGALTPLLTPAMIGRQINGAQLAIRYGLNNEATGGGDVRTHAIAGSGIFAAGTNSSIMLTAGVSDADCFGCSPEMMLGIGADMRVYEMGDVAGGGTSLNFGVSGDFGYAQLKPDNSGIVLGIGAPIALSMGGGGGNSGLRFVPYLNPVFGIGQVNGPCGIVSCERNGTRWVLGGGVGVWNPLTSISASLAINQVMLDGSSPVFGVNVVFGGR
jgi:hypothetical protein